MNVGYGPRGPELLKQGLTAREVLSKLLAEDTFEGKDSRQAAIIDSKGGIAAFTSTCSATCAGVFPALQSASQDAIVTAVSQ